MQAVWAEPFLQSWCTGQNPTKDDGVPPLDTPVRQHQFEITVAGREHQLPADRSEDHLSAELPALRGLICPVRAPVAPPAVPRVLPDRSDGAIQEQSPASGANTSAACWPKPLPITFLVPLSWC